MALIEKRPLANGKYAYRVRIKYRGRTLSQTFHNRASAKRWADENAARIRDDAHFAHDSHRHRPMRELIERYETSVLPTKRHPRNPKRHLAWWKQRLGHLAVDAVSRSVIAQCRDELLAPPGEGKPRGPATVVRYLASLSHVFSVAIADWEWATVNPVAGIGKPKEPKGRERFLSREEVNRLLKSCRASTSPHLYTAVVLALSTGMRRGEIVTLRWSMIDWHNGFIRLTQTKNNSSRSVPLTGPIKALLAQKYAARSPGMDWVFPPSSGNQPWDLKKPWSTALKKAGITDFRFHDLRHTAASHLAMNGATTVQLSEILGHKTLAMVKRYSHLTTSHTATVLEAMTRELFREGVGEARHG